MGMEASLSSVSSPIVKACNFLSKFILCSVLGWYLFSSIHFLVFSSSARGGSRRKRCECEGPCARTKVEDSPAG
jgi:hypothetical protein